MIGGDSYSSWLAVWLVTMVMSTLKKVVNLLLSVTSAEFGMLPPAMIHRLSRLSTWSPRAKKRWIATEPPNGLGGCRHQ